MAENHVTSKHQQWQIPLKITVLCKIFFAISVNADQMGMEFKANTPEK